MADGWMQTVQLHCYSSWNEVYLMRDFNFFSYSRLSGCGLPVVFYLQV